MFDQVFGVSPFGGGGAWAADLDQTWGDKNTLR